MFEKIIENTRACMPLIHSITNYVTVNDCANIALACGASPIMADDLEEVEDITALCSALVINIGTLNSRTVEAMVRAGKKANQLGHPVILDPVGAGASKLRTETTFRLLREIKFTVIRGNSSEIKTVSQGSGATKGVDADAGDAVTEKNLDASIAFVQDLSARTGAVIAMTGAIDLVANSEKTYIIRNGHPMMSKITGTGCMLTEVIAGFTAANSGRALEATAAAVCAIGLCGELAQQQATGTSSFRMHLMDQMSNLDDATLIGGMRIESR